jgi:hypothetical protein
MLLVLFKKNKYGRRVIHPLNKIGARALVFKSVFVLVFVVEVVVGYNPFMHKTQPQKLIFLGFCGFFSGFDTQPQPPSQIQTYS